MTTSTIKLLHRGLEEERQLEFSTRPPWRLRLLTTSGQEECCTTGSDLFECLKAMRVEHLEPLGAFLMCNGSRRDVYPSRMTRQMSGGRKAYELKLGVSARSTDLVDIFTLTPSIHSLASVAEQESFYERWRDSL